MRTPRRSRARRLAAPAVALLHHVGQRAAPAEAEGEPLERGGRERGGGAVGGRLARILGAEVGVKAARFAQSESPSACDAASRNSARQRLLVALAQRCASRTVRLHTASTASVGVGSRSSAPRRTKRATETLVRRASALTPCSRSISRTSSDGAPRAARPAIVPDITGVRWAPASDRFRVGRSGSSGSWRWKRARASCAAAGAVVRPPASHSAGRMGDSSSRRPRHGEKDCAWWWSAVAVPRAQAAWSFRRRIRMGTRRRANRRRRLRRRRRGSPGAKQRSGLRARDLASLYRR